MRLKESIENVSVKESENKGEQIIKNLPLLLGWLIERAYPEDEMCAYDLELRRGDLHYLGEIKTRSITINKFETALFEVDKAERILLRIKSEEAIDCILFFCYSDKVCGAISLKRAMKCPIKGHYVRLKTFTPNCPDVYKYFYEIPIVYLKKLPYI